LVSATRATVSLFGGGAMEAGAEEEGMRLIDDDDLGDDDAGGDLASALVVVFAGVRETLALLSPPRANAAAAEVIK